jgi:hypothetical protein
MPRRSNGSSRRSSRSNGRSSRRDNEPRPLTQIAGYVADRPEIKEYDGDEFTTFRVGSNRFYDDDRDDATRWYGVAINKPALQDFVQAELRKGTAVVVEGVVNKKEADGTVYYNMTGFRVGLVDWFVAGSDDRDDRDDDEDEDL